MNKKLVIIFTIIIGIILGFIYFNNKTEEKIEIVKTVLDNYENNTLINIVTDNQKNEIKIFYDSCQKLGLPKPKFKSLYKNGDEYKFKEIMYIKDGDKWIIVDNINDVKIKEKSYLVQRGRINLEECDDGRYYVYVTIYFVQYDINGFSKKRYTGMLDFLLKKINTNLVVKDIIVNKFE